MSEQPQKQSFLELLYGPHLHLYFKSVANTNMNGFSSSTPNKGLWESFVYTNQTRTEQFRSAASSRVIRELFIDALMHYGKYLNHIEKADSENGKLILDRIHGTVLSPEELQHFNMFFNIVHKSNKYTVKDDKPRATEISYADFKKLEDATGYRVNVKTIIKNLDASGAYMKNVNYSQKGGVAPTTKLAVIASYFPLVDLTDTLPTTLEKILNRLKLSNDKLFGAISSEISRDYGKISDQQRSIRDQSEQLYGREGELEQRLREQERREEALEQQLQQLQPEHHGVQFRGEPKQGQGQRFQQQPPPQEGTALGGGKLVGGADDNELHAAILRIILEQQFENPTSPIGNNTDFIDIEFVQVLDHLQLAEILACHDEKSTPTPISNTATLAALPSNMWRQLSDGSFQKWTADGYKPLSKEECDELMRDTCAGSNIPNELCKTFMKAINSQNANEILAILSNEAFVWGDNVAADSINKLHPQTVIRILKALHFGTKSTPFGKQVCSVDEWVSECIKSTTLVGATLSPGMRKYLEYLVAFVNSNPSLIDPSKRPFATTTSATGPSEFTTRGLYYVGGPIAGSSLLTFNKVQQALQAFPNTNISLNDVAIYPTMAYAGVRIHQGGQRGGTNHFYTQAATSQLSLGIGSGIKQLVKHALDGLKSTQQTIGPDEETKINKKVDDLIKLEQEIYHKIMQVNELRLAAQSGVNCNSQLMSAQGGLMQLGSVYDRKVPCLQELCEQLRMLLAQQQNSNGCQPIQ